METEIELTVKVIFSVKYEDEKHLNMLKDRLTHEDIDTDGGSELSATFKQESMTYQAGIVN